MSASQYGHIIKHLEVGHLNAIPMPLVRDKWLSHFHEKAKAVLDNRSRAFTFTSEAEGRYGECLGVSADAGQKAPWFETAASNILGGRRRLDASRHVPEVREALKIFAQKAQKLTPLSTLTERVFVPGRFKHVYGAGGTPYLDSAEILEVNPDIAKRVLSLSTEEQEEYRVEPDWLLMPCSGQVYGNVGHTILATGWHTEKVLSNHILRICPNEQIRPGYLQCALGHPKLGRPQLVRFAFGSSVPEIAPEDVRTAMVPRLEKKIEDELADLVEQAAKARDTADQIEQSLAKEAEELVDAFLAGDRQHFVPSVETI
jgi:type I restriction enzyme, S subunit